MPKSTFRIGTCKSIVLHHQTSSDTTSRPTQLCDLVTAAHRDQLHIAAVDSPGWRSFRLLRQIFFRREEGAYSGVQLGWRFASRNTWRSGSAEETPRSIMTPDANVREKSACLRGDKRRRRGSPFPWKSHGPSPCVSILGGASGHVDTSVVWTFASRASRRLSRIFRQLDASRPPTGISRWLGR